MQWFDEKARRFRAVIAALFLVLLSVSALNFYYLIGSPTDENWFTNTPAPYYLVRDIPATLLKVEKVSHYAVKPDRMADSLLIGDILLPSSKNTSFLAFTDSLRHLRSLDTLLTLTAYRPAFNQVCHYQLASRLLPDTLLRLLPPTVAVFSVARGGASDRAGMKLGDLILSINNKTFKDMFEADAIMRSGRTGKSTVYEVLRRNETLRLNVTLARLGIPFTQLIFMLTGCAYMALGLFLGLSRPQIKAARLLALGFTLLGYVLMLLNTGQDVAPGFLAVLFKYPLPAMAFFSIALLMHSTYYVPRPSPLLLARRWPVILPYAAALICSLLVYISVNNRLFKLLALYLIVLSILPLFLFRKQVNPEHKRLSRIIRLALLATLVLTVVLGWHVNRYASPISAGLVALAPILIPAAYLHTIGRYRLFDLNLRIRRNIRYSILVTLWIIALISIGIAIFWRLPTLPIQLPHITLTGSSIEVVDTPQSQQEQAALVKGVLMVLAVVSVLALWKIGKLGTRFLARQFHRDQYDYRRASQLLNEVMNRQADLAELAEEVVERVNNLMHLNQIGVLFFRENHEIACGKAAGLPETRWNEFMEEAPALAAKLAAWLPDEERFTIDYLPEKLNKKFFEFGFRFLMPILTQDRLRGLFLLGEKNSETPFYQEDYQFLRSISQPGSVAIENALLYEELARRERLRHEMEIARRIQLASLPQETPHMPGLEIAGLSIPALEVGGDYYEYLNGSSECITIVVGDVSGKGISAALYMSKVQGIIRSLHSFHLGPRELCVHLNRLLGHDLEKNYFVTALAAEIRTGERRLVLTRAGHLPLYHYSTRTRAVESLTPRGIGFALREEEHFGQELEEMQVSYEAGDIFLFATDGVTESRNSAGDEFGEVNLMRLLAGHADLAAAQLCSALLQELRHFSGTALQADDLTMVVVKAV